MTPTTKTGDAVAIDTLDAATIRDNLPDVAPSPAVSDPSTVPAPLSVWPFASLNPECEVRSREAVDEMLMVGESLTDPPVESLNLPSKMSVSPL